MSARGTAPRRVASSPAKNLLGSNDPFRRSAWSATGTLSWAKPSILKFGATTPPDWLDPVCEDCAPLGVKSRGGGGFEALNVKNTSGTPAGKGKPSGR